MTDEERSRIYKKWKFLCSVSEDFSIERTIENRRMMETVLLKRLEPSKYKRVIESLPMWDLVKGCEYGS